MCYKYLHLLGDFQIHLWKIQKCPISSAKMTVALNCKSPPHNICWKVFSLFRITFVFQEKPEVIVICEL